MARRKRRQRDYQAMSFFSFQDIITCVTGIMLLLALTLVLELVTRKAADAATPAPRPQIDAAAQKLELKNLQLKIEQNRQALEKASLKIQISQKTLDAMAQQANDLAKKIQLAQNTPDITDKKKEKLKQLEELKKKNRILLLDLQELHKPKGQKTAIQITLRQRQSDGKLPLWVELGKNEVTVNRISSISHKTGIMENLVKFSGAGCVNNFLKWANTSRKCSPLTTKFVLLVRPDAVGYWPAVSSSLKQMGFVTGCDTWNASRQLLPAEAEK